MSQQMQTMSNGSAKSVRSRALEKEAPVLAAIAVLLTAWLILALGGG
jgi:hypothetical protein